MEKLTPELKDPPRDCNRVGARDLQNMQDNENKISTKLKGQGVQFPEFDKKDYQTIVEKAGDPYEHCRKYLVTQGKVDAAVADKFIKRWRELNQEYEKNYLVTGKKWQYK
jgi:TRAP-type C4-dicarboxylate transport system substrate-binding protein